MMGAHLSILMFSRVPPCGWQERLSRLSWLRWTSPSLPARKRKRMCCESARYGLNCMSGPPFASAMFLRMSEHLWLPMFESWYSATVWRGRMVLCGPSVAVVLPVCLPSASNENTTVVVVTVRSE